MGFGGQAAIDFLVSQIRRDDPGASSHWRLQHKNFGVNEDGTFSGLSGFGGAGLPYKGLRALVHKALQRRYRRLAHDDSEFERIDRIALSTTEVQARAHSLDVLRQSLTLAFLKRHIPALNGEARVGVIGDGFASMTTLLLASKFAKKVVLVNLNKTLLVDLTYFQRWAREHIGFGFRLIVDSADLDEANQTDDVRLIAIQASNHDLLRKVPMDLVVNIASMQEMDPPVISAYFEDLRLVSKLKPLYFYCCNREEKKLPDGVITRFSAYPWQPSDRVLVDELCPWHQQYYSVVPPFYRNYDGPTRHRLVEMSQ